MLAALRDHSLETRCEENLYRALLMSFTLGKIVWWLLFCDVLVDEEWSGGILNTTNYEVGGEEAQEEERKGETEYWGSWRHQCGDLWKPVCLSLTSRQFKSICLLERSEFILLQR